MIAAYAKGARRMKPEALLVLVLFVLLVLLLITLVP